MWGVHRAAERLQDLKKRTEAYFALTGGADEDVAVPSGRPCPERGTDGAFATTALAAGGGRLLREAFFKPIDQQTADV